MQRIEKFKVPYEFLSNAYPSTFFYHGIKYKTVSNAYYSLKAPSNVEAEKIRSLPVDEAIKVGKSIEPRTDWQTIRENTMLELLRAKFDNPFLAQKLLDTGDAILGNERNFVGRMLMNIREEIKRERSDKNRGPGTVR